MTDTCIPEEEAFRRLQTHIYDIWKKAEQTGERYLPHEYMFQMINSGVLKQYYEIDPKNSWMIAAAERNLPIVVGGWEDSTMANIFASYVIKGELKASTMKSGIEYMVFLADWYKKNSGGKGVGCQISDSTTSYGSYSGAVPNEKITWGKLDIHTPKYIVESDATIVAPLIFAYVLGW